MLGGGGEKEMWRNLSLALAEALEGICISVTSLTRIAVDDKITLMQQHRVCGHY